MPKVGPGYAWSTLGVEGPLGRTGADVALLLAVIGAPDRRDPLHRPIDVPDHLESPDRPLRVAWSCDIGGTAVDPAQVTVLDAFRPTIEGLGWDVVDHEPDLRGAEEYFRTLRPWEFATGPVAQLDPQDGQVKATILAEIRRGHELTPAAVARADDHPGVMWRRSVELFSRYDLLVGPVTQVAPLPCDWEYPTEIAGRALTSYIDWMAACFRITVLGNPALPLPAGCDSDGLPVGIQLVGPPGGDVDVLRAAATLEAASGHRLRRPPRIGTSP